MGNKDINLKDLLNKQDYGYQAEVWYRAYGITTEKIELFYDFVNSVYQLINKTYLGPDAIITEEEQRDHFTWCWDKTVDNLTKEKIKLNKRGIHYEYFWDFFLESFYFLKMDEEEVKVEEYLYKLFNYTHKKTRSELSVLTEIYKLLEKNLN
jgi:hypothetical protein